MRPTGQRVNEAAMHAAAEAAGLMASKGAKGWHLNRLDNGERVTPADAEYDARQARAYAECWLVNHPKPEN